MNYTKYILLIPGNLEDLAALSTDPTPEPVPPESATHNDPMSEEDTSEFTAPEEPTLDEEMSVDGEAKPEPPASEEEPQEIPQTKMTMMRTPSLIDDYVSDFDSTLPVKQETPVPTPTPVDTPPTAVVTSKTPAPAMPVPVPVVPITSTPVVPTCAVAPTPVVPTPVVPTVAAPAPLAAPKAAPISTPASFTLPLPVSDPVKKINEGVKVKSEVMEYDFVRSLVIHYN